MTNDEKPVPKTYLVSDQDHANGFVDQIRACYHQSQSDWFLEDDHVVFTFFSARHQNQNSLFYYLCGISTSFLVVVYLIPRGFSRHFPLTMLLFSDSIIPSVQRSSSEWLDILIQNSYKISDFVLIGCSEKGHEKEVRFSKKKFAGWVLMILKEKY
jgi:hypothetical protein